MNRRPTFWRHALRHRSLMTIAGLVCFAIGHRPSLGDSEGKGRCLRCWANVRIGDA